MRMGDEGGKASSAGFRGVRTRLGDPEFDGLAGRSCGEYKMRPEPLTPGMDCVRPMAREALAADSEREWPPDSGDAVRGR